MEDKNEETGEVGESEDSGEGDKSETTKVLEQQSKRIKELEAERDKKALEDAKKQMASSTEAGGVKEEPKKNEKQLAKEYIVENFEHLR